MATKISEVIESLLDIQKIHGDIAVYALALVEDEYQDEDDEDTSYVREWLEADVKQGVNGTAICVKIEGLS